MRIKCDYCDVWVINGVICHAWDCPNNHAAECKFCDSKIPDFPPDGTGKGFCSPCCTASYYGSDCDCWSCESERDEMRKAELAEMEEEESE